MELKLIELKPDNEVIIGQGNFSLKAIEDLYDAVVSSSPGIKFGVAMNDGSERLTRVEGNDQELREEAAELCQKIGAGHVFVICFRNAFPLNVLNAVKGLPTVATIYVATSNPIKIIVAEDAEQRAIIGVMDGFTSKRIEDEQDRVKRKDLLKKFGYRN